MSEEREDKTAPRPRPRPTAAAGTASRPRPKPAAARPVAKPAAKAATKPAPKPASKPAPKPVSKPAPKPVTAGRPSALLAWAPAALLGVAALVFAILIGVDAASGSGTSSAKASAALREQVLAAAKQCVAQANTYDYRTLAASQAKAQACTTGKYHVDNLNTFTKVIKKDAPKLQATQSLEIDVAGIEDISEDGKTWKILLFGTVKVTNNTSAKDGRFDPEAIEATMTKVGSKWLVSELLGA
jgi:hypothetical protein